MAAHVRVVATNNPTSIADTRTASRVVRLVTALGAVLSLAAVIWYARLDLTLSHYDARGHLIVARRVIDSLTPGWQQLGAIWLPLPHMLNVLPVQWDWSYRTGASGAALSMAALLIGLRALAGYLIRSTLSWSIAVTIPLVILLNPNVLYLQSTPMTEPLLFGLALLAAASMDRWLRHEDPAQTSRTGAILAALMLTRYEGWFIAAALVGLGAVASPRRVGRLALYPAGAVVGFLLLSWGSTGSWFVTSGFFEPNNPARGSAWLALRQVVEGASNLGGRWLLWLGLAGIVSCVATGAGRILRGPSRPSGSWTEARVDVARALVPLSLVATAALPLYAFFVGHPTRIRYMTPVVVAAATAGAFALARLPRRLHVVAAGSVLALAVWSTPPWDLQAPMVREAQWERPYSDARRSVTAALAEAWDGTPIMASMGSLGHYMQQMSAEGFNLRDFLHEGNGSLWRAALVTPRRYVKWILIEESAEGGDVLATLVRANPAFLAGFTRTAESGGVALYVRTKSETPQ